MKNLLIALTLTMLSAFAWAQNHQWIPDTAVLVVDRYLKILNYDNMPSDSMLYIETIIVDRDNPKDTTLMKRWFVMHQKMRGEIYVNGVRQKALRTNGKDLFREFKNGRWRAIDPANFYTKLAEYDFRGPLYNWRTQGVELEYKGSWMYNGNEVYRVLVHDPFRYDRYYLFDKQSGLLFMIDELPIDPTTTKSDAVPNVDWRAIHEYYPIHMMFIPSEESYQIDGNITLMHSTMKMIPIDERLFNK